jgi:Fe-S-cluster containining protein
VLEIELPFRCVSRADCCREPPYVVVSESEQMLLPRGDRVKYVPHRAGFWRLLAHPCPFLTEANRCSVYEIRPYNCRRFICGRPHDSTEPWIMRKWGECRNMTGRLSSAKFLAYAQQVQIEAQPWARAHGWGQQVHW